MDNSLNLDIFSKMSAPVYITDRYNRIIFWNRACERLIGYTRQEVIGKHCYGIIKHHTIDNKKMCFSPACILKQVINYSGDDNPGIGIAYIYTKTGERVLFKINYYLLRDDDNIIFGVLYILNNVNNEEKTDIIISRHILEHFIPKNGSVSFGNITISSFYLSHSFIGGDFLNYFESNSKKGVIFWLGDSEGDGVSAALISMMINSLLFTYKSELDIGHIEGVMKRLNNKFSNVTRNALTVTMLLGYYEYESLSLSFVNAGSPGYIMFDPIRKESELHSFPSHFLGIIDDFKYGMQRVRLKPGQMLLFYTDGVFEFKFEGSERFGEDRLMRVFNGLVLEGKKGEALLNGIYERLSIFNNDGTIFEDDFSLLLLEVNGE